MSDTTLRITRDAILVAPNGFTTKLAPVTDLVAMTSPVRCLRCYSGVYDLTAVHVLTSKLDCTVWDAPCCGARVDDRISKSMPDFQRIEVVR